MARSPGATRPQNCGVRGISGETSRMRPNAISTVIGPSRVRPAGHRRRFRFNAMRSRTAGSLFVRLRSLSAVVAELARRRWKTKSWTSQNGTAHAGRDFAKASLRRLLTNAIYAGKVEHRGATYDGEQASIVEPSMWQEVNTELRSGSRTGTAATRVPQNALLAGLLVCKSCKKPMIPTYTAKPGRRYRC